MAVDVETVYYGSWVTPLNDRVERLDPRRGVLRNGGGYLAGSFPDGITTIEGAPTSATVRVILRSQNPWLDGMVVAVTESAPDGTWLVEGLDPDLRYDVVGRKDGFNDVIVANVSPATD